MSYVVGIDPGQDGGIALLGDDFLMCYRMPVIRTTVGRTKRDRVDPRGVWDLIASMTYADLVVIEGSGGRPRQSASAAHTIGFGSGLLYMACIGHRLKVETVQPHVWKKWMKVPPKRDKASMLEIMKRADDLFPDSRDQFYTPRGRALDGCAEAALLASWGREHVIKEGRWLGNAHQRLVAGERPTRTTPTVWGHS